MSIPFYLGKSDESGDSKPEAPRPTNYDQTLRLLFSEDPEEDETLQPISSGLSIDVNAPKVGSDGGDNPGSLCGEGEFLTIEKKIKVVRERLNPVPFVPGKIPFFSRHEDVLRGLGLWEFVHMDFDRCIRMDLLAQLVGTYNSSSLDSYVNGRRVKVSKAALGLALNLPVRKRRMVASRLGYSDDSLEFLEEFLDWLLLHKDEWVMPSKVKNWSEMICRGRPDTVDWAGLVWVMVEKELAQAHRLRDCYYASHLQRLMKWQHEELFLEDETCEIDAGVRRGDEHEDVEISGRVNDETEEGYVVGIPSDEMRQGEYGGEKDYVKEMVEGDDGEKGKSDDNSTLEGEQNSVEIMEGRKVAFGDGLHGLFGNSSATDNTNADIEHNASSPSLVYNLKKGAAVEGVYDELGDAMAGGTLKDETQEGCVVGRPGVELMQGEYSDKKEDVGDAETTVDAEKYRAGAGSLEGSRCADEEMVEGEDNEEEREEGAGEGGELAIGSHGQFGSSFSAYDTNDDTAIEPTASSPSLSHQAEKAAVVIEHENDVSSAPLPIAMPTDLEQIHKMMERAKTLFVEKEFVLNQKVANQQILMSEIQRRDALIQQLDKIKSNEIKVKDVMIYRLERELHLKKDLLDAYKKALKATQNDFDNYMQRANL